MNKIYAQWAIGFSMMAFWMPMQAQQLPQYSLYMLNPYGYHAAYAGLDESLVATGVFRKQWVSFPGSPLGFQVNAHLPLNYLRSGVGLSLEQDRLGAEVNTSVRLSYSYIINMNKAGKLAIGGGGSWMQKGIDGTLLRAPDGTYEGSGIIHNDDYIPNTKLFKSVFSAEAGIYYKHPLIEAGFAFHHLPAPLVVWETGDLQKVRYKQHLTGSVMANIPLAKDFSLHPSLLIKSDLHKVQPELALILNYRKMVFGGLAFRGYSGNTQDAVVILAGVDFAKHFRLAYAYDISISGLKSFNSGSHEVVFSYNMRKELGKGIPPKIIYNPRFL